jgi:hypothetical protein
MVFGSIERGKVIPSAFRSPGHGPDLGREAPRPQQPGQFLRGRQAGLPASVQFAVQDPEQLGRRHQRRTEPLSEDPDEARQGGLDQGRIR